MDAALRAEDEAALCKHCDTAHHTVRLPLGQRCPTVRDFEATAGSGACRRLVAPDGASEYLRPTRQQRRHQGPRCAQLGACRDDLRNAELLDFAFVLQHRPADHDPSGASGSPANALAITQAGVDALTGYLRQQQRGCQDRRRDSVCSSKSSSGLERRSSSTAPRRPCPSLSSSPSCWPSLDSHSCSRTYCRECTETAVSRPEAEPTTRQRSTIRLTQVMRALLGHERRGPAAASVLLTSGRSRSQRCSSSRGGAFIGLVPMLACVAVLTAWAQPLTRWRNLLAGLAPRHPLHPDGAVHPPGQSPVPARAVSRRRRRTCLGVDPVDARRSTRETPPKRLRGSADARPAHGLSLGRGQSKPRQRSELRRPEGTDVLLELLHRPLPRREPRRNASGSSFHRQGAGRRRGRRRSYSPSSSAAPAYNVFNHLHTIFPLLQLRRRGTSSSGAAGFAFSPPSEHPIALSVLFVILLPLVLYLARRDGRRWLVVAGLYVIAIFTTGSRTGIIGLLVLGIVYLCLQPRLVLRAWPLAIPILAAVHVAAPGALGTIRESFDPTEPDRRADSRHGRKRRVRERTTHRPGTNTTRVVEQAAVGGRGTPRESPSDRTPTRDCWTTNGSARCSKQATSDSSHGSGCSSAVS